MAHNPGFCAACGFAGDVHEHHIVPRIMSGADLPTVFLCVLCHGAVHSVVWNPNHAILTHAGLERAKAEGAVLGRPGALSGEQRAQVQAALAAGASVSEVARQYGTSRQTIMRVRDAA